MSLMSYLCSIPQNFCLYGYQDSNLKSLEPESRMLSITPYPHVS